MQSELTISSELSTAQQQELEKIKERIDLADSNTILQYGAGVQGKISEFADTILSEVKSKDTAYVGQALSDLMFNVRELRAEQLDKKNFWSRIPGFSSLFDGARRFASRYQSVSTQIIKISEELEKAKTQLLNDVSMLDNFYEINAGYFQEIGLYILAGEQKLQELNQTVLPELKREAEASNDQMEMQRYRDLVDFTGRVEKKIHDLKLSRTVALQTAPQIRLVQRNNQDLAEKIQSSILNTIPLWKNQMVMAISLLRQKQALGLQQEVSRTTNELLEKNAELLKQSSIEIAKESEAGIVDIETIKKVNAELISTIDETIKIHQEAKVRRKQAAEELQKLEQDLKSHILQIKNQ